MLLLLPLCLLLAFSCKKKDVAPIDQLPAATQEGKMTMGCLVNGKAWTPKGNNGTLRLGFIYEPGYANGSFSLGAYRLLSDTDQEFLTIGGSNLNSQREFSLDGSDVSLASYMRLTAGGVCFYYRESEVYREGKLVITRLDVPNHIIAGTFEFTLARPGCDTIRVTDGRFDMKF